MVMYLKAMTIDAGLGGIFCLEFGSLGITQTVKLQCKKYSQAIALHYLLGAACMLQSSGNQ